MSILCSRCSLRCFSCHLKGTEQIVNWSSRRSHGHEDRRRQKREDLGNQRSGSRRLQISWGIYTAWPPANTTETPQEKTSALVLRDNDVFHNPLVNEDLAIFPTTGIVAFFRKMGPLDSHGGIWWKFFLHKRRCGTDTDCCFRHPAFSAWYSLKYPQFSHGF